MLRREPWACPWSLYIVNSHIHLPFPRRRCRPTLLTCCRLRRYASPPSSSTIHTTITPPWRPKDPPSRSPVLLHRQIKPRLEHLLGEPSHQFEASCTPTVEPTKPGASSLSSSLLLPTGSPHTPPAQSPAQQASKERRLAAGDSMWCRDCTKSKKVSSQNRWTDRPLW